MSWSNNGNSQDPVTTNYPNSVGFQTIHSVYNPPPIQIPPQATNIPQILAIPSFEQVLAATLQQNNLPSNNFLPSFSTLTSTLPAQTMNPFDSRTASPAWSSSYGIPYTPASHRSTLQPSQNSSTPSPYYSVIPAKRVHPDSTRSDRHSSDSRYSSDHYSSRYNSSRGRSSSDRNYYDSSKRHRSGSERSSTASLRPASSSYTSSHANSNRRSDNEYSSSNRTSSSQNSYGLSKPSSFSERNFQPPPPPPPAIKSQGVLSNVNGRMTIDRFQEYARLVGNYPYVRDLLNDVPSQFELPNDPAFQALFELPLANESHKLMVKRVALQIPEDIYSKLKKESQLRIHIRSFVLNKDTKEHSWPTSTQLLINNNTVTIVSKANDKKLQDLPADITAYCRPGLNFIDFISFAQENFIAAVQIVRLIPAEELFSRKKEEVQEHDKMFQKVLDFFHAGDSDIAATKTKVSLIDSLSLQRIQIPARASTCLPHLQCFDLYSYITANYKIGKWLCPVCSKKAAYNNLFVDSYTQRILNQLEEQHKLSSTREVEIHPDGTWNRVDEEQKKRFESIKLEDFKGVDVKSSPSKPSAKKNNIIQVINLDSDDEDEGENHSATPPSSSEIKLLSSMVKDEFGNGSPNHFNNSLNTITPVEDLGPIMQEPSYNNEDVHNSSGDFAIDLNAPDLEYFDFGTDQISSYQNTTLDNINHNYVNTATENQNGAPKEPIIIIDDD